MNSSIQKSFQQYGSIVSQAKEQRAKKEAGGTSFGAQILAQSAAGLGLATGRKEPTNKHSYIFRIGSSSEK